MSDTAPENDNTKPPSDKPQEVVDFATIEIVEPSAADPEPVRVIGADDALRGLHEAVAEKGPDYVYTKPDPNHHRCVYAWPDPDTGQMQPQCIVGYALAKLGVPAQLMYDLGNEVNVFGLAERLRENGYQLTREAVVVLAAAQMRQDAAVSETPPPPERCNWGAALNAAHAVRAADQEDVAAEQGTPEQATDPTTTEGD